MTYFDQLNYTLANEDTWVEYNLLEEGCENVFSICGSGARVLPLIARNPKSIVVNDLVREQLYLCELRLAAARALTHSEFLFFLGYRGGVYPGLVEGDDRYDLFQKLEMSDEARRFWTRHTEIWAPRGFITLGRWESHFQKLSRLFRNALRIDTREIFEAQSLDEQRELFERKFPHTLFRSFLRVVASEFVFNRFLYKGHFAGGKENRTDPRPPWKFLDEEFRRMFETQLVRKSYFLQILFLGRIYFEEGLPLEAQAFLFPALKESKTSVTYRQGDLVQTLGEKPFDFVSLSDTISYLSDGEASGLFNFLSADVPAGSRVVIRSFLRAPELTSPPDWRRETDREEQAFLHDCTSVYRVHIFRKRKI